MEAAEIAVVGTRADMRGDEEPQSFYKTDIERVARLIASHSGLTLPRSRRVVEPQFMYSRARLSPLSIWAEEDSSVLQREVRSIRREVGMGVDEAGGSPSARRDRSPVH